MEVISRIREYIAGELLQQQSIELGPDLRLIEEGYLTSLETLDLVMFLEERFGVQIDPEDVNEEHFATLGSISDLVASKLRNSNHAP